MTIHFVRGSQDTATACGEPLLPAPGRKGPVCSSRHDQATCLACQAAPAW